jgi:hypothetical protein
MPVIGQTHCRRSSRRSSKGMYQSGTVIPCRHSGTSDRPEPTHTGRHL